jgi:hypothetical protein
MRTSFYTYFSSGYGTIWLIMIGWSLITRNHLETGSFGLIGFPIIAAIYAALRRSSDADKLGPDKESPAEPGA